MKYLYGAAVQGIQGFIFQTNELKDIVGASELVENICTTVFAKLLYGNMDEKTLKSKLANDKNAIINAAGNIKYIFEDKEECAKIVRTFPKTIVELAPGITVSQAVVEMQDDQDFGNTVNELENKLRIQRNKPMNSTTIGLMGIRRSRRTNMPVVCTKKIKDKIEYLDSATIAKRYDGEKNRDAIELCKSAFGIEVKTKNVAFNIEDMLEKNDWIAIIHADGNGLGQVVQQIGTDRENFKKFSRELDDATKLSAQKAFESIKNKWEEDEIIPIRPIVLGGDDFTAICRADLALEYVNTFIKEFEKNTRNEKLKGVFLDGEQKLTACAGIAYVKSSYPFYYGYEMAEALCSRAKKDAKKDLRTEGDKSELPKSCLMFHKIQDSFVNSFEDVARRELNPNKGISFEFGPYYTIPKTGHNEKRWSVDYLLEKCKLIGGNLLKDEKKGNAVKSHLRNWLTLLNENPKLADQKLMRLLELLNSDKKDEADLIEFINESTGFSNNEFKTPIYDILTINTINNQTTR